MKVVWVFLSVATGCAFDGNGVNQGGGIDADLEPVDGSTIDAIDAADEPIDAGPIDVAPIDVFLCTTADETCLDDDTRTRCVAGDLIVEDCPLGCLTSGGVHCAVPVPSNGVDLDWLDGAGAELVVGAGEIVVFETQTGVVQRCGAEQLHGGAPGIEGGINYQRVSTALGAWAFASLRIEEGGVVRMIGERPGAILVAGEARIQGTLDVSAGDRACNLAAACGASGQRFCAGPGAGVGGLHDAVGAGPGGGGAGTSGGAVIPELGAGGGGFGAGGGRGGGSPGAAGGMSYGVVELSPLIPGSGGGGGGESTGTAGRGGGGGGGLQLVAVGGIEIDEDGVVLAAGSGGSPGVGAQHNGGGGGGSGGALLLETPALRVRGALAANGGGGGGGGFNSGPGASGGAGTTPAAGGEAGMGHAGGAGGAGSGAALAGAPGTPSNENADGSGGGGGGVGRIFLRTRPGGLDDERAVISPPAGLGTLAVE